MNPVVLVVDDESDICKAIKYLLERDGYSVALAYSGEEAIDAIHKDNFSAILTDWKMSGIDGLSVLKKAKEVNCMTPVLIMTAYGSQESLLEAVNCGAEAYIIKPFRNEEVTRSLRNSVDRNKMLLDLRKVDIGFG